MKKGIIDINSSFSISYDVSQDDITALWDGIIDFNKTIGPMMKYPPYEPYRIILKNENNEIVAGILTKIYLKSMYVELLWIDKKLRKSGIGKELLKKVEIYAKEKGCTFIHLDTWSFQAIDFYKKYGYEVFATLEDYPENIKRYYLKKYL